MEYSEFTLESAIRAFEIDVGEADLFPALNPVIVPQWLPGQLARGTRLALLSEKARSEFIVVPILLAVRELSGDRVAIFSGQRLDVDAPRGLAGECDFLLAIGPSVPPLRAPIAAVVEAKKNDVEAGLGQCIAQLVAAREFNKSSKLGEVPLFGCVTTGEAWQFLRLLGPRAELDSRRFYLDNVPGVLAALLTIVRTAEAWVKAPPSEL
jgi:hypothetical protein